MTRSHQESADGNPVSFSMEIRNGETVITMRGDRDTAVVVRSDAGERIYLPPEDFDRDAPSGRDADSAPADSPYDGVGTGSSSRAPTDSPYQSAPTDSPSQSAPADSPYRGAGDAGSRGQDTGDDSPYQPAGEAPRGEGLSPTADGYRIRHPEPVTDVRVLR
jgi:hypothetical protein